MKNLISSLLLVGLLLVQSSIFAQENNEAKTLFGSGNGFSTKDLGFFIAPSFSFTELDGDIGSLFNIRGGINLKDRLTIGAFYTTSLNQIVPQSETIPTIYLDYWTVGGFAEYTLFSKRVFHVTMPLYFGYGEVEMDNENVDVDLGEANFLTIEPSALLEVNLHRYVRFNLGAGYRMVGQMNYRNFNQSDISGFTGYIGLKIGLFK